MNLIDKWVAMQAVQGIDSVATLRDGDPVIRMSAVEHVLENLPEAPDINVGNIDTTTHDSIPAKNGRNDEDRTSGDCISRQAAIDALKEKVFSNLTDEFYGAMQVLDELPSAQPDDDRLERCRFEYVNACKIVTHPTPDTTKKDIDDAYAVVRALNPIFWEEGF